MSLWTSLEPASTTVDPGGSTTVRLRLRNTGDVVDEYRCVPVGELAPWTTVEPGTLRLYPGTTGTVELTFAPPRTPDAAAGPHPYGVQIIPTEFPEATTVPEGNVTVTPFSEVRAELVPTNVTGRFRGRPRLAIDNLGNVKLTASVTGHDNSDQLSYEIHPANVQVEPGRAAFLKTTLKPRQIIWAGAKQSRPYTLSVQRSGAEPLPVRGTYVQPGLLPRWLGVLFSLLLGLAIAFLMIWLTYKPDVATKATDKTPGQTAHTIQPSAPAQPTPQQTTEAPKKDPGGGGGGGGGGNKPKRDPYAHLHNVLLRNGATHKCVDLTGYSEGELGHTVMQFGCNGSPTEENQRWSFELMPGGKGAGPGGKDLFQVRNLRANHCLDVRGPVPAPNTSLIQESNCTRRKDGNQVWWLERRPATGQIWIRNATSNNYCLDVKGYYARGEDLKDATALTLANCTDGDDQGWLIEK
ncbi:RICIN domain-containing protein [Streptomyces catenulae]|uniref:RICIN domain-containing protein n=1 Tax=Streptomyces catenulae TaxID=66875 RepID=A0ABV2YWQ2_9ACTN|nr:RICIN domain-containing protein [Streptomyces catenulae]